MIPETSAHDAAVKASQLPFAQFALEEAAAEGRVISPPSETSSQDAYALAIVFKMGQRALGEQIATERMEDYFAATPAPMSDSTAIEPVSEVNQTDPDQLRAFFTEIRRKFNSNQEAVAPKKAT